VFYVEADGMQSEPFDPFARYELRQYFPVDDDPLTGLKCENWDDGDDDSVMFPELLTVLDKWEVLSLPLANSSNTKK